jgi:hypothetical protein
MRTEERTAYFLQQLKIGDQWAEFVASQITEVGKYAYATPTKIAESEEHIKDFTENEKDILLSRDRTLEVKSRSFHFTSVNDYPYETAFVDTVEGWLAKRSHPVAVAVVSQKTGCVVVVPVSTSGLWSKKTIFDSKRGFEVEVFECPRSALRSFEEFLAWL